MGMVKNFSYYVNEVNSQFNSYIDLCKKYNVPINKYWNGSGTNYGITKDGVTHCSELHWGLHFTSLSDLERYFQGNYNQEKQWVW